MSPVTLTFNFHVFFLGSLVFILRFEKLDLHRFFLIRQKMLSNSTGIKYGMISYLYRSCFPTNQENLSIMCTKNFNLIQKSMRLSPSNCCYKPPIAYELQTQNKAKTSNFAEQ